MMNLEHKNHIFFRFSFGAIRCYSVIFGDIRCYSVIFGAPSVLRRCFHIPRLKCLIAKMLTKKKLIQDDKIKRRSMFRRSYFFFLLFGGASLSVPSVVVCSACSPPMVTLHSAGRTYSARAWSEFLICIASSVSWFRRRRSASSRASFFCAMMVEIHN